MRIAILAAALVAAAPASALTLLDPTLPGANTAGLLPQANVGGGIAANLPALVDGPGRDLPLAVPGVVPEPATWGMMIAGFGAIGLVARRRRATGAA